MSDIQHRIAKFISSQKMELSETQRQVLSLGKQLVQELGLDPGVDTFSRWMAHYVAEQITLSEKVEGEETKELDKRCFESILQLWVHHASYAGDRNPFKSFEPVFKALYRLDPEKTEPYHYSLVGARGKPSEELDIDEKATQEWVNIALNIDVITKVLVEFSLAQAIDSAKDGKTEEWLTNAANLPGDDEVSIILNFVKNDMDEESAREKELKKLNDRLKKLDGFESICSLLRETYKSKIDVLSKEDL